MDLIRRTLRVYTLHGGRILGAATAFYMVLAVAPLLVIALTIVSVVYSREAARAQLMEDLALWIGQEGAELVSNILDNLTGSGHGSLVGVLSAGVLVYAATRLFAQLRYALNHLWGVREVPTGGLLTRAWSYLRRLLVSLAMMFLVVGVLISQVLIKAVFHFIGAFIPLSIDIPTSWQLGEQVGSVLVVIVLFAGVFKVLPAVRIAWRDAWVGGLVTGLLFSVGSAVIGWYLGRKAVASTYGAAGSLVALLIWVNYSAQIFFLGAAFTRSYAELKGRGAVPEPGAVRIFAEGDAEITHLPGHPSPLEKAQLEKADLEKGEGDEKGEGAQGTGSSQVPGPS